MSPTPHKHTILVVDDAPAGIDLLCAILGEAYHVKVAVDGVKALKIVRSPEPPDLILLDILMPGMDGYEVCRRIKGDPDRCKIPIMFLTAREDSDGESLGLSLGAADYITKPYNASIVLARVKAHLALYDQTRELERLVDSRTMELQVTRLQIIHCLGRAAEYKDNETGFHVLRMAHYARLIAEAAGLGKTLSETLFLAAPMHDIGKIGTPDHILLKPGKLDEDEWKVMRAHTTVGGEIIGGHEDPLLSMARTVALAHHEKWDGTGYPSGIKGDAIPLVGRVVAIADVFDALTSERPYKKAWTVDAAMEFIVSGAGSHFDPSLIEPLKSVLTQMLIVKEKYADGGDPVKAVASS
jgi:putative two-component system response regulator